MRRVSRNPSYDEAGEVFWKDGCEPLIVEFDLDRLRALGRLTRKEEFSTEEAKALLLLYREQLEGVMVEAVRKFLKEKL
jgi:hypothetical protein